MKVCLCVLACLSVHGCELGHAWPGSTPGHTRVDVPLCPREGAEGFLYTGLTNGG